MKQLLLILILILPTYLYAQHTSIQNKKNAKIGYVLSGGGAKGLAHIGVLKVLEELDMAPDYITGTSMGAIVGGLYAAGYNAHELDSIVSEIDWATILTDDFSVSTINILERPNYNQDLFYLQFDKGEKPTLPAGLVFGHAISNKFAQLTDHVAHIRNFDNLAVPYRCMGTDLNAAQSVALNNMPLAKAMRSSMAIPSVFAPVKHDSMLLVDGGVMNNFPVRECKKLGANIIIGVNAGFAQNTKAKEYKTITSVLMRAASFMGDESTRIQKEEVDLFIEPDLKNYGVENFDKATEIIAIGEKAAREPEVYNKLKALANKLKTSGYKNSKRKIDRSSNLQFNNIQIKGIQNCQPSYLKNISKLSSDSMGMNEVHQAINSMYSTNQFNKITYNIDKDSSEYRLSLLPEEKKQGQFSGSLNYSRFKAGMILQNHFRNWITPASSFKTRILLSENPRLLAEFRKYSGKNHNINYVFSTYLESQKIPNFTELNEADVELGYLRQLQVQTKTGIAISSIRNTVFSLTGNYTYNLISLRAGLDKFYKIKSITNKTISAQAHIMFNNQDDKFFPSKGINFEFDAQYAFYAKMDIPDTQDEFTDVTKYNVPRLESQLDIAIPLHRRISLLFSGRAGLNDATDLFTNDFFIGGYNPSERLNQVTFAGLTPNRYSTNRFLKLTAAAQFRLFSVIYFKPEVNYGRFNISYTTGADRTPGKLTSYGASLGYKSFIGPIQIGVFGNSKTKSGMIVVNIGYPF
jgi:NTE family protein